MTLLRSRFSFVDSHAGSFLAEVELAHVDWPLIGALHELGFNQLSVAVPDLRADDGSTVEYFRSSARIRGVIEAAHELHYRSVNLDLGYGRRSVEHTSELQSLMRISYAVFCLKKKT